MGFGSGYQQGFNSVADRARLAKKDQLEQATSMAALNEAGYNLNGNTLTRDPNFINAKQLEAKKTQLELDKLSNENENMRKWGGMFVNQQDSGQGITPVTEETSSNQSIQALTRPKETYDFTSPMTVDVGMQGNRGIDQQHIELGYRKPAISFGQQTAMQAPVAPEVTPSQKFGVKQFGNTTQGRNGMPPGWTMVPDPSTGKFKMERDPETDPIKQFMMGEKENQYKDKQLQALGKDIDPAAYRTGAFGIAQQSFDRAERLQSLGEVAQSAQSGGMDSRQTEEMAIGLNSLIQGGNQGAMAQVQALVPSTIRGDAIKIAEWIRNEPTGLQQQAFTKRLLETIDREKATFKDQIKRVQYKRLGKYPNVRKGSSQEWESLVRGYGIDPAEYDAWVKEGSPEMSAVQKAQSKQSQDQRSNYKIVQVGA